MSRVRLCIGLMLLLVITVLMPAPVFAGFTWANAPAFGDMLDIKYQDYEILLSNPQVGDKLFGVGFISAIENQTAGNTAWQNVTSDGGEITAIFYDYTLKNVIQSGSAYDLYFEGGVIKFFWDSSPDRVASPKKGTNANPDADGGVWSNGILWLELQGVKGVVQSDQSGGSDPTYDETNATLTAHLDPITGFVSNQGKGLLDVVGGAFNYLFDSNHGWLYNPTADLALFTNLTDYSSSTPADRYPVRSSDPISGQHVPEPGTLVALLGGGLSALLLRRRRR